MQSSNRPVQNKKRYFLAFLIGTLIFLLGFAITTSISYFQFQRISDLQGITSYGIFIEKLKYGFFEQNPCSEQSFRQISDDLRFQGVIIDDLEKKLGKNNPQVLFRKKFYTLIEVEHLEFIEQLNKECDSGITTILFFYSNEESDLGKSEETGKMLDYLYQQNADLIIYSFDMNLDSELIQNLRQKFNIQDSPTLIINQETKIIKPSHVNDILKFLPEAEQIDIIRL